MNPRIYFDHSATTPLDPQVLEAMGPYLGGTFGNPSSLHHEGRVARAAVEKARAQVADVIRQWQRHQTCLKVSVIRAR